MIDRSKVSQRHKLFQSGLSVIELLIVVSILSLLIIGGLRGYFINLSKARDATRKSDLNMIKVAFTDYLGDYGCFPDLDILENCGGDELAPYLDEIPCDPSTFEPYQVDVDPDTICPRHYRVLTVLERDNDPVIAELHCDGEDGCGGEGLEEFNYGVADGVPVGDIDYVGGDEDGGEDGLSPSATPVPTSVPAPGDPTSTPTTVPAPPTSTPTPGGPTAIPTPTPVYTHCCPHSNTICNDFIPGESNCDDGDLFTSHDACKASAGCDS